MMCLGVFLLWSNFFGRIWAFWTSWKSISFTRLGKFFFIIFSNKFSISCSSSSPSGSPMIRMLEQLKLSQRFLSLSSFFGILVSSFCPGWTFFLLFVPNHWFESQFPSLYCWFPEYFALFLFGNPSFVPSFWSSISFLSILIARVLNSAPDRLAISLSLSSFSGVLICSFVSYFFVSVHLLSCKGVQP